MNKRNLMQKSFEVSGVCAKHINVEVDGSKIKSVEFVNGCPGSLVGVGKLVQGKEVAEVIGLLEGITCGEKETSCPDQLAQSLKKLDNSSCGCSGCCCG